MSPGDHTITVRAQNLIKRGEEITIQYLSFMYGHLKRKSTIKDFWHFDCGCKRCQDPSELKSNLSALKCPDCESGILLPLDSMNPESEWLCGECKHKQSAESVRDYVTYCDELLMETALTDRDRYEKLLQEFLQRLHPNHYIGIKLRTTATK